MDGAAAPAVELSGVTAGYDRTVVLSAVDLTIASGQLALLVGPNGGGKSTLMKLICGLLAPWEGEVSVHGEQPRAARRRIGYLAQVDTIDPAFPIDVADVVAMGRLRPTWRPQRLGPEDRDAVDTALGAVGMTDLARRPIGALSGGQRRRVLLARTLACEPDLLVLDEPAAGLDPDATASLHELLIGLAGGRTVVVSSHNVNDLESCAGCVATVNCSVDCTPCAGAPQTPALASAPAGEDRS